MTSTSSERDTLQATIDDIAQHRDELKAKIWQAKADTKAEWEQAETKWRLVESEMARVRNSADEAMDDIRDGVQRLATEIKDAYGRISASVKT